MKDKELLELAAKAAGITYKYYSDPEGLIINDDQWPLVVWNPLTDDGDALRLAVKLGMNVFHAANQAFALDAEGNIEEAQDYGVGPYAATRRAIIRAAARIGKEMK